jgi:hypothetical protein
MPLTAEDRERFLSSLHDDEAFREEVRCQLFTAELLSLPAQSASLVNTVEALAGNVQLLSRTGSTPSRPM